MKGIASKICGEGLGSSLGSRVEANGDSVLYIKKLDKILGLFL